MVQRKVEGAAPAMLRAVKRARQALRLRCVLDRARRATRVRRAPSRTIHKPQIHPTSTTNAADLGLAEGVEEAPAVAPTTAPTAATPHMKLADTGAAPAGPMVINNPLFEPARRK